MPDYEVIEHLDVEQLAGLDGLLGQPHIVGRRGGIAARVIVDEDDPGGVLPDGFSEDLALPSTIMLSRCAGPTAVSHLQVVLDQWNDRQQSVPKPAGTASTQQSSS